MSAAPKTVLKALSLLNLVARHPNLTLSELGRKAGVPAPTALRLLRALQEESLVQVDGDGRYRLGVHCLVLGSTYLENFDLRTEARAELERLAEDTGETVHLGVPEGTEVIYVDKVETSHSVRMYSRVGAASPMYSTGIGKAILSHASPGLIQEVVAAGLAPRTPNTITDPDRLRAELEVIRERGYAVDDIENEEGIRCAAAVVLGADGSPVAAVSVSGPATRITPERIPLLGQAVQTVTGRLSALLGYRRKEKA
ncbi:MAG: IclR family transcriptional regulator [Actinomycetota bacterium]